LLEALLDGPAPVILVVDSGRPYALGTAPDRAAAIVQTFFPGEEGAPAVARVLSGAVNPSGRLPVSVPAHPDGQPWTYLSPRLAHASEVSDVEPGQIELRLGASSADIRRTASLTMVGPSLVLDHTRGRHCRVSVANAA
jgi:Glycosyl hydrolase family 3 C-terminal domain